MTAVGITLLALGGIYAIANLYITFLRYPFNLAFGGTRQSYRWVSGVPAVGSILLLLAILALPRTRLTVVAAVLLSVDTGGLLWFAGLAWWARWRQSGRR